jgi:DnaJ-class molecular chaperone
MSAGKGDSPRNCFSQDFRDNYDSIDWKNARRDKVGKMFPEVTDMPTCWDCNGRGYHHCGPLKIRVMCAACKGKKRLPLAEWKKSLEEATHNPL